MLKQLIKLQKQLRAKATYERKRVGSDTTHYEGMKKGLWLAYEDSASAIDKIINQERKDAP